MQRKSSIPTPTTAVSLERQAACLALLTQIFRVPGKEARHPVGVNENDRRPVGAKPLTFRIPVLGFDGKRCATPDKSRSLMLIMNMAMLTNLSYDDFCIQKHSPISAQTDDLSHIRCQLACHSNTFARYLGGPNYRFRLHAKVTGADLRP